MLYQCFCMIFATGLSNHKNESFLKQPRSLRQQSQKLNLSICELELFSKYSYRDSKHIHYMINFDKRIIQMLNQCICCNHALANPKKNLFWSSHAEPQVWGCYSLIYERGLFLKYFCKEFFPPYINFPRILYIKYAQF